jgi:hypothetical protein
MPLPVPLYEVVDQLEAADDEWCAYINRKTGEIAAFSLDMQRSVEDGEEASQVPDWERETREDCERVLGDPDFVSLPSKFDIHEWDIMKRFCLSLDGPARERLLDAIRGRGAFRMFKSEVHRLRIQNDWYRYRDEALKKIAIEFLEAEGIPYVDAPRGSAPPDSSD